MNSRATAIVLVIGAVVVGLVSVRAAGQPSPRAFEPRQWLRGAGAHIGLTARDLDAPLAARLKVSGGAVVEDVQPGTPAEKAGFKKGDVVLAVDGVHVRSARHFARVIEEATPDRAVRVTMVRDGHTRDLSVVPEADGPLGSLRDGRLRERLGDLESWLPPSFDLDFSGSGGRLGVTVTELTPQLAEYFRADHGVLVTSVVDRSAAGQAGVKAGDVIAMVNGQPVRSRQELVRAIRALPDAVEIRLGIVRDKKESALTVKLPSASPTPVI